MSDDKTQSTTPDNSGQPTTTQNNAGQQTSKTYVFCPSHKSFQAIKCVKVESSRKRRMIEKKETPWDVLLSLIYYVKPYLEKDPSNVAKMINMDEKQFGEVLDTIEKGWSEIESFVRNMGTKIIKIKLECGHEVTVTPYKIFDTWRDGYYAGAVLHYLSTKRLEHEKDEEKERIAKFVYYTVLSTVIGIALNVPKNE